uniref:Neur_chan_memb domain-containing protein n=1 Tax=Steinernema glaseri TaxID=37863 RepID=A0A1I7YHT7_9BILA
MDAYFDMFPTSEFDIPETLAISYVFKAVSIFGSAALILELWSSAQGGCVSAHSSDRSSVASHSLPQPFELPDYTVTRAFPRSFEFFCLCEGVDVLVRVGFFALFC